MAMPSARIIKNRIERDEFFGEGYKSLAAALQFDQQDRLSNWWFVFILYDLITLALPFLLTWIAIEKGGIRSGVANGLIDEMKAVYAQRNVSSWCRSLCDIGQEPCSFELAFRSVPAVPNLADLGVASCGDYARMSLDGFPSYGWRVDDSSSYVWFVGKDFFNIVLEELGQNVSYPAVLDGDEDGYYDGDGVFPLDMLSWLGGAAVPPYYPDQAGLIFWRDVEYTKTFLVGNDSNHTIASQIEEACCPALDLSLDRSAIMKGVLWSQLTASYFAGFLALALAGFLCLQRYKYSSFSLCYGANNERTRNQATISRLFDALPAVTMATAMLNGDRVNVPLEQFETLVTLKQKIEAAWDDATLEIDWDGTFYGVTIDEERALLALPDDEFFLSAVLGALDFLIIYPVPLGEGNVPLIEVRV
jgi:hypothetical protein